MIFLVKENGYNRWKCNNAKYWEDRQRRRGKIAKKTMRFGEKLSESSTRVEILANYIEKCIYRTIYQYNQSKLYRNITIFHKRKMYFALIKIKFEKSAAIYSFPTQLDYRLL